MGALGGLLFLIGLGVAFIGFRHLGEDSIETARGSFPPMLFVIGGLVAAGLGLCLAIYSFMNGFDGTPIDYNNDFFKESSK